MTRPVPADRRGYSVDLRMGVVHTRYPAHGDVRPRVRTLRQAQAYLRGDDGIPCDACYPPPTEPESMPKRAPARKSRAAALPASASDGGVVPDGTPPPVIPGRPDASAAERTETDDDLDGVGRDE